MDQVMWASSIMPVTEHTINDALAELLSTTRRLWRDHAISSENTGMLRGSSRRPDILINEPNVSPVVIETEVLPAVDVESEAAERLGESLRSNGRLILSAIAVRLPVRLRAARSGLALRRELAEASDIEMALFTGPSPAVAARFPATGWVVGNVADLSILAQSASVPPDVIEGAANQLVEGVNEAAGLLDEMARSHPVAVRKIAEALHQEDAPQTRRMAMTILANAFVFHENLAGGPEALGSISSLEELRDANGSLAKGGILSEWRKILAINYWPIFDIARRILTVIPTTGSRGLIDGLAETASRLLETRLMRSHDLTGAVFQRLIADRKYLAAFYTTPASAALLVGLAITPGAPPSLSSWANPDDVKRLRVADFACGTGTLISTAYQRIGQLHELAGGDIEALHPHMMANALTGCDVLPAAAHLTASMLAGAHPTVKYDKSMVLTVAYGKQPDGEISLGSLALLDPQGRFQNYAITAKFAEGLGENERETWTSLAHATFDLVIMNPPFTRSTGHESNKIGVPRPMFAAFGSDEEEQRLMAVAAARLTRGTSASGNAGEASIFLVLGNRKLKSGGVLALVMPLSLVSGDAWEKSRLLLSKQYADLIVVSIAGPKDFDVSFSADTGSGECLVVGRKRSGIGNGNGRRATFAILHERPPYAMVGAETARQIRRLIDSGDIRKLEDGPVGGTPIPFGGETIGHLIDAPLPASGGWYVSRVADLSLAQAAYQMISSGRIWLPAMSESQAASILMTTVAEIAKVGPYHSDVEGRNAGGGVRGPFAVKDVKPGAVPTYPVLWSHDATRERTMRFEADCEGLPLKGKTVREEKFIADKVDAVWALASHCHLNRDFRFNSQSTSMQFTTRRTIGGRAWPSLKLTTVEQEKALVLWSNTTFGLLIYWWHANKQQTGRGSIGVKPAATLPVLSVVSLSEDQLAKSVEIFDAFCGRELLPLNEIDRDLIRAEMDFRFAREVLGLKAAITAPGGPLDLLRMKLAQEPSIHRGKKSQTDLSDDDDEEDED